MTGFQLRDWLAGPKDKTKLRGLNELLREVPLTTQKARSSFSRSRLFGRLQSDGFVFEYSGGWVFWPLQYTLDTEVIASVYYAYIDDELKKVNKSNTPEMPESEKQKNLLREKAWHTQQLKMQAGQNDGKN